MENVDELKQVLFDPVIDTDQPYEHQFNQHRNNFNEVYEGSRWVGLESGLASRKLKINQKVTNY